MQELTYIRCGDYYGMQRAIFAQGRMWKPIAQIGKNF